MPIDSKCKVGNVFTMFSIPHFWNHIIIMQSMDDSRLDQNQKKLRVKRNTKWNEFCSTKFVRSAEYSVEDIKNLEPYISCLNARAIQMLRLHGNQEQAWNTQQNP
jgi:hypothetical protein